MGDEMQCMSAPDDATAAHVLIEDWAAAIGVKIKWFHDWSNETRIRVTGFGYDQSGRSYHYTAKYARDPDFGWDDNWDAEDRS